MLYRNIYIGFGVCLVHLCDQQMSKINIIYNFIGRVIKIKKKIKQNKKMSYLVIIPILAPEKINKFLSYVTERLCEVSTSSWFAIVIITLIILVWLSS